MPLCSEYIADKTVADLLVSIIIVLLGTASAFNQGGVFGIGSVFPPEIMGAIMFGQGSAGIVCNILMAFCLLVLPPEDDIPAGEKDRNSFYGTILYYVIASVFVVACIVIYFSFMKTRYAQYYLNKAQ